MEIVFHVRRPLCKTEEQKLNFSLAAMVALQWFLIFEICWLLYFLPFICPLLCQFWGGNIRSFPSLDLPLPIPTVLNSEDPGNTEACSCYSRNFTLHTTRFVSVQCAPIQGLFVFLCFHCVRADACACEGGSVLVGVGRAGSLGSIFSLDLCYGLNVCVPPDFLCWKPDAQSDRVRWWGLWEMIWSGGWSPHEWD